MVREILMMEEGRQRCNTLASKVDELVLWSKDYEQYLDTGKGKEQILPSMFHKEMQPCSHLAFSPMKCMPNFWFKEMQHKIFVLFQATKFVLFCYVRHRKPMYMGCKIFFLGSCLPLCLPSDPWKIMLNGGSKTNGRFSLSMGKIHMGLLTDIFSRERQSNWEWLEEKEKIQGEVVIGRILRCPSIFPPPHIHVLYNPQVYEYDRTLFPWLWHVIWQRGYCRCN